MTQDEIIEMAQECGLIGMRPHLDGIYSEALVAFAKLVVAKKQEDIIQIIKETQFSNWFQVKAMKQALESLYDSVSDNSEWIAKRERAAASLRQAIAELESQEPVAWVCCGSGEKHDIDFYEDDVNALPVGTMLYTHPPQRTWVGLTPEEFHEACWESYVDPVTGECSTGDREYAVRWTEAKLKEKNNA
jgi:hypothetical protein